ncbi:MAG: fatty acid desaturase [Verrucomicrobia bacterium]|nr:fatty acid desaturase [Verrucomicrobiota bacterium]
MNTTLPNPNTTTKRPEDAWKQVVADYQQPSVWRASWQLVNTFGFYALLWYFMYLSRATPWVSLPLAVLAGALLVRVFIIFHDCGHGSFLRSSTANIVVGWLAGVLTFTPFYHWRWEHAHHHATSGDLDRRGTGDIWTLTVQEYLESSRWQRFAYKLARNPVILFVIAPVFLFVARQRFSSPTAKLRERQSVWFMNLALLAVAAGMSALFGLSTYLLLQLVVITVAGSAGVWMFYVQHQFEDAYWEHTEEWDYTEAALKGSSFYRLPKVLQWFTGNIGFHHIHHLSSRIPNYNLERCHNSHPMFNQVKPITILTSLKSLNFRLWDEQSRKLVGYRLMRERRKQAKAAAKKTPGTPPPSVGV